MKAPGQPSPQYHSHPDSSASHYTSQGVHSDPRPEPVDYSTGHVNGQSTASASYYPTPGVHTELRPESADYSSGHSNGHPSSTGASMYGYPTQYAGAYGHPSQPPHPQQQPEHHHHQHPSQQYAHVTHQPVRQPSMPAYMDQGRANQLPPMGVSRDDAGMGVLPPVGNPMNPPPFTAAPGLGMHQPALAPPQPQRQQSTQVSAIFDDKPTSKEYHGYIWSLKIVQQPQRARMCGFGDKDRRPITPPPVVQLIITDPKTGRELAPDDLDDTIDYALFTVSVDLYSESKSHEAGIVRANNNSPSSSISSATTTAYPPTEQPLSRQSHMMVMAGGQYAPGYAMPYAMPVDPYSHYGAAGMYPTGPVMQYHTPGYTHGNNANNYSRNLIGSLTVNAAKLNNENGQAGFYFVFQDLSVRTESKFRMRMSFVNLSDGQTPPRLNRGKAPILCWVYTDPFQVYSAKKFPGVIESTALSKTFASQGIKIPIRKDNGGKNDGANGADGGDDDDGE